MSPTSITTSPHTHTHNQSISTPPNPKSSIPTSSSQPTITKSTSQQSLNLTSPSKSSTPTSKNYHPYLIHSSASSLLTRTNSSPAQPPSSPNHHRSSRSMSSLNYILENGSNTTSGKDEINDRRKSMESPQPKNRPGVKRSGTLPEFLNNAGKQNVHKKEMEIDLPINPKLWTPSELAQYLGHTLRTGGPEGTGQVLPAPLVEDIKSWVLRQRVSGRDFLKGSSDGWGNTTRPPPFLPLLQTIARRLRRHSLSGRIESIPTNPDDSFGKGSVLMEENEDDEEVEDGITGVKKMANAFDARSSSSSVSETSASGDDDEEAVIGKLKPQWTGESVGERWKAWEDRLDSNRQNRNRKVSDVSSIGSASEQEMFNAHQDEYPLSTNSEESEEDEYQNQVATIKAPPPSASTQHATPANLSEGLTPPPPYSSSFPDNNNRIQIQALPTLVECLTPERSNDGRYSVTPTPERTLPPASSNNAGLGIITPSPDHTPSKSSQSNIHDHESSPHMMNMSKHSIKGSNPYAALRRRSSSGAKASSGPTYPSIRNLNLVQDDEYEEGDEEEEGDLRPAQRSPATANFAGVELEGSRWTTARRVTLRPSKIQNVFDSNYNQSPSSSSSIISQNNTPKKDAKRNEEVDMSEQMNSLLNRIKELENKLENVTTPSKSNSSEDDSAIQKHNDNKGAQASSILESLGLSSRKEKDDDGLPRTVRELPIYLFLVGFGVGAVVVRVLFGRSR